MSARGFRRVGWPFVRDALVLERSLPLVVDPAYRWSIDAIAFHPDGERIVAIDDLHDLFVISRATGQFTHVSREDIAFTACGIADDGRVVIAGEDVLAIWDLDAGAIARQLEPYAHRASSLALHPAGHQVVVGSDDGAIELWDLETGTRVRSWQRGSGHDVHVAITQDHVIATGGGEDGTLWALETGRRVASIYGKSKYLAAHPDGRVFAGADSLVMWRDDDDDQRELERPGGYDAVTALAITPDGRRLIVGHYSGQLALWDLTTNSFVATIPAADGKPIESLAIADDGTTVAAGGHSVVHLWSLTTGQDSMFMPGTCAALTPLDGGRVLASGTGHALIAWDVATGACQGPLVRAEGVIAFADREYATVLGVSSVERLRLADGDVVDSFHDHAIDPSLAVFAFARRGTLMMAPLYDDHHASLLDLCAEPENDDRPLEHPAPVTALAFAGADGERAVTGDDAGTVRIWRTIDRACLHELAGTAPVTVIAAHPRFVLAGRGDGTIVTWDVPREEALDEQVAPAAVVAIAISPSGIALVADADHNAQLWDPANRHAVPLAIRHPDAIVGCAWLGVLAVTAGADGLVRAWDPAGALVGCWQAQGEPRAMVAVGDRLALLDDSSSVVVLACEAVR